MVDQSLKVTLASLLRRQGPISAADLAALVAKTSSRIPADGLIGEVLSCLRDEPRFTQREDGTWSLDVPPPASIDAKAPIRFADFPLFCAVGSTARGDETHPDFVRMPVARGLSELGLTPRVLEALEEAGICTVGDLVLTPSDRVLDVVRLIGKTRLRYLRDAVKSLATKHLADLDAEPSSGDASAGQHVPADFEGYSLDSDWDGRCPTCDNPAEATDVVTDDGDGVFRCPECNEWFYVEITSAADTEEDQSESQDGTKAEDLSVEHGETMTEDEQAGKKIVRPTDAGQVRREVGRRKQRDESVRKDASSLFQFLHDVVELRSRTVRSVDQYAKDGHVLWLTDVPRERGCLCAAWPVDDGESTAHSPWLEVARPRLEDWPEPPVVLRPWLDPVELADSSLEYPELQERVPRTRFSDEDDLAADDEGNVGYEQVEGILEMWSQYVERRWQPWAVRDGRLQPVQTLYNDLFSLHQTLQSRGDEFELIVGVGLLQWQRAGHEIKRHLLTTSAELRFESDRGRIVLEPGPEGVVLRLEQDMLEVGDRPSPDELAGIAGRLDDAGDDFWHGDDVKAVARMWVNSVAADGRFADELAPQVGGNGQPMVTWSPALILRKRTARPLLEFYENALRLLGEGEEISDGVAALVAVGGGREPDDHRPVNKEAAPDPEEVFFPLPANEEQLEILHRMNASTGVLVQGPPGTGKSHTIANLITHLLATGKRVLVTSQTPRALRVLQQKLPREIADLCVLLVGDDRDAMRDLDRSVQGITDRFNHWDADENTVLIARLEKRLDEARRRAEVRRKQLIALRESEIDEYSPVGGSYAGSLASIARRLREEQPRFGWLTVADDVDVGAEPPLSNGEARELLALVRRLGEREMDLIDQPLPSLDDIPSGDAFEILIEREAQARASCEHAHVAGDSTVVTRLTTASEDDARSLRVAVDAYRDALLTVSSASEPWAMKPLRDLLSGRGARWEALMKSCGEALTQLDALGESAAKRSVVGLDDHDLLTARHHAEMLRDHLVSGGSLGNFLRRAEPVKRAKYLIDGVRVDGRAVDCEEALSQFVAWIDVNTTLERLDAEWRPHCEVPAGTLLQRAAEYRNLQSDLTAAFSAHAKGRDAQGLLASAGVQTQCDWCDVAAVTALGMDAEAAIDSIQLTSLEGQFTNLADSLRACGPGDSPRPLLDSVVTAVRDRDAAGLRVVRRMIADAWTLRTDLARKDELLDRLSAGSQTSADRLVASIDDPDWQDRLTTFEEAWSWALADRWLDSSLSPGSLRRLSDQLDRDEQEARGVLNELAAARAWGYCFQRMTPIERMNLVAWMKAVRKIGKGKGKYAARYRREAREYLEGCRSAIPAWVMPTFRVAETIRPGQDRFDVVIIDEASQSGLESLFLHYLGDKLIVVGDDRQISPEYVGTNLQDVEDLRRRHISGLPLSPTFGVGTSLFSQAEIRFGNRVRLREHFRCMPEIIQFCNQLQYAGAARPIAAVRLGEARTHRRSACWRRLPGRNGVVRRESPRGRRRRRGDQGVLPGSPLR